MSTRLRLFNGMSEAGTNETSSDSTTFDANVSFVRGRLFKLVIMSGVVAYFSVPNTNPQPQKPHPAQLNRTTAEALRALGYTVRTLKPTIDDYDVDDVILPDAMKAIEEESLNMPADATKPANQ